MNKTLPSLVVVALATAMAITLIRCIGDPAIPRDRDASNDAATPRAASAVLPQPDALRRTAVVLPQKQGSIEVEADPNRLFAVADLPEGLRDKAIEAIRQCRFSNEQLGVDWPRGRPKLTIEGARRIIAAEEALQGEILASACAEQNVLVGRMQVDPGMGVSTPSTDFDDDDAEARLREMYPGWPDGYVFASMDDGRRTRIAGWKVKGDPELEALQRDGDSLRGDYARVARSTYRRDIVFE